jgi:hypothetical protein
MMEQLVRRLVWTFSLLVGACAAEPERVHRLDVDAGFDPEQLASMALAADRWNAVSRHRIELYFDGCQDHNRHCIRREVPPPDGTGSQPNGYMHTKTLVVMINPPLHGDAFLHTITHEFGHVVGIEKHTTRGVMAPGSGVVEITADDLLACRTAGSCD